MFVLPSTRYSVVALCSSIGDLSAIFLPWQRQKKAAFFHDLCFYLFKKGKGERSFRSLLQMTTKTLLLSCNAPSRCSLVLTKVILYEVKAKCFNTNSIPKYISLTFMTN